VTTHPLVGGPVTVGLDIGGTKVHGLVLDAEGVVLHALRLPTVRGRAGVVSGAADVVRKLAAAAGLTVADLAGVGVGVPGVVDPATGEVRHAVNLGIQGAVPLGRLLSAELDGLPVRVDNDLNVAALGAEHALGPDGHDLAYLALGTGVAAGLVLDGRPRRGARGGAGEIGHIPLVPDGLPCPCGQRGCLERYASGAALDAAWPTVSGRPAPAELFDAAASGDPRAVEIRDEFARAVAAAVQILVLTCDVDRVVLGGGVSELGAPLLEVVVRALDEVAASSPFLASAGLGDRVRLTPSGVAVAAIGAALLGRGERA